MFLFLFKHQIFSSVREEQTLSLKLIMNALIRKAIHQVWADVHSPAGLPFPQTVARLQGLGVQRYHIDYVASTATAYIGNSCEVAGIPSHSTLPALSTWDANKLIAAIRKAQAAEGNYIDFSTEAIEAGVTNYFAYLEGKRVVYMGAMGDIHTEWFPGSGPATKTD
jgi:uncharacterized protein YbcV (DUF1398 family)